MLTAPSVSRKPITAQIDMHDQIPFFQGHFGEGGPAKTASAIDQKIDGTELGHGFCDHPIDVGLVGGIGVNDQRWGSSLLVDRVKGLFESMAVQLHQAESGAHAGQLQGREPYLYFLRRSTK